MTEPNPANVYTAFEPLLEEIEAEFDAKIGANAPADERAAIAELAQRCLDARARGRRSSNGKLRSMSGSRGCTG